MKFNAKILLGNLCVFDSHLTAYLDPTLRPPPSDINGGPPFLKPFNRQLLKFQNNQGHSFGNLKPFCIACMPIMSDWIVSLKRVKPHNFNYFVNATFFSEECRFYKEIMCTTTKMTHANIQLYY